MTDWVRDYSDLLGASQHKDGLHRIEKTREGLYELWERGENRRYPNNPNNLATVKTKWECIAKHNSFAEAKKHAESRINACKTHKNV